MPHATGAARLVFHLEAAWEDFSKINDRLVQASREFRGAREPSFGLLQVRDQYENESRLLLIEPIEQYVRLRPIRRSLEGMQEFDKRA
jgi:hypothetical protein